jgi:hypothetical protein
MGYAPVNNTIVFAGTKANVIEFLNLGLRNSILPCVKDGNIQQYIEFLMANGRHYELDRRIREDERYFANGLTMGTFRRLPDNYLKYTDSEYDYNYVFRFGCDFDAEITSMCFSNINGYCTIEVIVETNSCPPEKWVKYIKEVIGFKFAFIHSADYDENCFNYFKEIDEESDHEYTEKYFEIEAEADDDEDAETMLDSLNDKIENCFTKYILDKTKE